jgi:hypothetical protein
MTFIAAYKQVPDGQWPTLALPRLGQCQCPACGLCPWLHVECPSIQCAGPATPGSMGEMKTVTPKDDTHESPMRSLLCLFL